MTFWRLHEYLDRGNFALAANEGRGWRGDTARSRSFTAQRPDELWR